MNRLFRVSPDCQLRGVDEAKRQATFVAATERAVTVGPWEPEVLRMKGCRLDRYLKNPVVLDSHNRFDLGAVIGRADVTIDGSEMVAVITYADTERGENVWRLVKGGFVRGVSVGYNVNPKQVRRLRDGETDGEGPSTVTGPATVVSDWEMIELSNVPVPADEDAVRRTFYDQYEGARVADPAEDDKDKATDDERSERAQVTCPECGHKFDSERAAPDEDEKDEKPKDGTKAAKGGNVRQLRPLENAKRDLFAITPKGLESIAERCLLEGKTHEEARKVLLEEHAKRHAPAGTPEPDTGTQTGKLPEDITDDVLLRSLESLAS